MQFQDFPLKTPMNPSSADMEQQSPGSSALEMCQGEDLGNEQLKTT